MGFRGAVARHRYCWTRHSSRILGPTMKRTTTTGSLLIVALVVAACGGGAGGTPGAAALAVGTCDGQSRPQLDCSAEFKYDATNVQGTLHVGTFANVSGSVEQKALREIDQQTAMYVAEARRLCDEYNKCVVDKDTYGTRSENMRRRIAKTPELLESLKSGDEDAQRAALAKAYREIVPDGARTELRLTFSVLARRPSENAAVPIPSDASLPSGSHVTFDLQLSRPAYVYLFQKSASGAVHVLFPDVRVPVSNPVAASTSLQIPTGGASFRLDDRDLGTERVYIVASLKPVSALAAAADHASQGAPAGTAIQQLTTIDGACKSRGLSLDEGAPPPTAGCARPRGLSLDTAGDGKASMVATTEAADDTIATVFQFRHTH
jgi:hypothetical protein